jgi:phage shock protein A
MTRGDEALARQCLSRKLEHTRIMESLRPQWEQARKTSDVLKSDLRRMEEKLEETIRRRDVLIARQMAAEAQKQVQSVTPSLLRVQRNLSTFDRMERRIEDMEAEAAAMSDLTQMSTELDRSVEKKQRDADVELEMAALKAKVGTK